MMAQDDSRYPQSRIVAAAELVGRPEAIRQQRALLADSDSAVRYWGAAGLRTAGEKAAPARAALVRALDDSAACVRIEAAAALVQLREPQPALDRLTRELQSEQLDAVVHAARALQWLGEKARPALSSMRQALVRAANTQDGHLRYVGFSLEPAFKKLADEVSEEHQTN